MHRAKAQETRQRQEDFKPGLSFKNAIRNAFVQQKPLFHQSILSCLIAVNVGGCSSINLMQFQ